MTTLGQLRSRLRIRTRLRGASAVKDEAQLRWWVEQFAPDFAARPELALADVLGEAPAGELTARRWQRARAEVMRVQREAEIEDEELFTGKVVVDIGPGPLGFPDACPARVSIGVDPLAERYAEHGLMLPGSDAVYLNAGAEAIPLLSASADIVLARNSLDYVDDPERALAEIRRILRPGGLAILLFDVGSAPSAREPHTLGPERVRAGLGDMTVIRERRWDEPFALDGHRMMIVARR